MIGCSIKQHADLEHRYNTSNPSFFSPLFIVQEHDYSIPHRTIDNAYEIPDHGPHRHAFRVSPALYSSQFRSYINLASTPRKQNGITTWNRSIMGCRTEGTRNYESIVQLHFYNVSLRLHRCSSQRSATRREKALLLPKESEMGLSCATGSGSGFVYCMVSMEGC